MSYYVQRHFRDELGTHVHLAGNWFRLLTPLLFLLFICVVNMHMTRLSSQSPPYSRDASSTRTAWNCSNESFFFYFRQINLYPSSAIISVATKTSSSVVISSVVVRHRTSRPGFFRKKTSNFLYGPLLRLIFFLLPSVSFSKLTLSSWLRMSRTFLSYCLTRNFFFVNEFCRFY